MISLALRRWQGEVAAALAVDGAVRAALRRKAVDGCQTGESTMDRMILDACRIADLKPEAVRQVVTVDGKDVEPTAGAAAMVTTRLDAAARADGGPAKASTETKRSAQRRSRMRGTPGRVVGHQHRPDRWQPPLRYPVTLATAVLRRS